MPEPKYKIIGVDNFDRECVSDTLVCDSINKYWGDKIVEFMNKAVGGVNAQTYYKLVPQGHKLFVFEP